MRRARAKGAQLRLQHADVFSDLPLHPDADELPGVIRYFPARPDGPEKDALWERAGA